MSNNESIRGIIKSIIPALKNESQSKEVDGHFSYTQQRAMINQIFSTTSGEKNYNVSAIMLRLIVIDSLYSTNAAYSYFSFEEMAEKINNLGTEKNAAEYFYDLVKQKMSDSQKLFSTNYGIRKNLTAGSKQMSLMSKYAYYVLLQNPDEYPLGFPIYDSLAIEMYPKVCEKLGVVCDKKIKNQNNSIIIEQYIEALNRVRQAIFDEDNNTDFEGYQQYDLLDAYLWRMGKLDNGNYSLLFDKTQYKCFIKNIALDEEDDEKLYKKFKPNLVKKIVIQKKDAQKVKYDYDFNKLVRHQCKIKDTKDILKGIENNDGMSIMIEHWKNFYNINNL